MKTEEIDECFEFARELAQENGEIVKNAFFKPKNVDTKSNPSDLVTETDRLVEKNILEKIKAKYPNHKLIGEESFQGANSILLTDEPTWVIDPIDGTSNFVTGFPFVAVVIGFIFKKQPVFGVVFNPILNEMFSAQKEKGSFLNGEKISVKKTKEINDSVILSGFSSGRNYEHLAKVQNNLESILMSPAIGIRMIGSTACAMTMVAAGKADAYFGARFHIWDICAPSIILTEAGGFVSDLAGKKLNLMNRQIISACSNELINKIAAKITPIEIPDPDGKYE